MKLFIKNVKNLVLPTQAHPNEDACFDVVAASDAIINGSFIERGDGVKLYENINYIEYNTNLFVAPEEFHFLKFYARSSISKYNLILKNNVPIIDNGFRANILLRYAYTIQPEDLRIIPEFNGNQVYCVVNEDLIYHMGDKCAQFEICKTIPIELEIVEKLPHSIRNDKGLGSSGK